jgi:signal transduction histidine kinase
MTHGYERREPARRWMRHMPAVTGALLAALVIVPLWLRERTQRLRETVTDVALPARTALLEVQNAFASELAAIRGFELTGAEVFLDDFRAGLKKDQQATERLRLLAAQLSPEAASAVAEFEARKDAWLTEPREAEAGRRSREQLIQSLMEGERRVDGVLLAADKANAAVERAEAALRRRVMSDERAATVVVLFLALSALAVATLVASLVRRLNIAAAEAGEAVRYRDQMLRVVSHDLKNPLHTIGMVADLLATSRLQEDEHQRQLAIVVRTVERMNRLIHDLLDAARVQSGHSLPIIRAPVTPRALFREASELLDPQARARNIKLSWDSDGAAEELSADRDRLLQVFSNLVGNALKFTPEGGRIDVRAKTTGGRGVTFEVKDTGPGIAAEDLPRLFEPFWQAHDGVSLGTGLGLSIVRGIVEAHGGKVHVESKPGEGSSFTFAIPTAR